MNRKQRAVLLIALLCAAWVCSAAFMAAFAWHDCQAAHCPICPVLAQCLDVLFALSLFLPLLCKCASFCAWRTAAKSGAMVSSASMCITAGPALYPRRKKASKRISRQLRQV